MNNKIEYLKIAVDIAKQSFNQDLFPCGAVIVKDGVILSQHGATPFPKSNLHSDSKCIDEVMEKVNSQLDGCTLYTTMEPCLMCFSKSYWAGLKKIVYIVSKGKLPSELCYESGLDDLKIIDGFNKKFEIEQDITFEKDVLDLFDKWLSKIKI